MQADKIGKIILIFSTQRSGSTMVTSDFAQTQILGNPSEYFTENILPASKFDNCSLSVAEIKNELKNIFQKAKTSNGIISIKIMSDYIIEIAKAIETIKIDKESEENGEEIQANNFQVQERKAYLQKLFIDFFNNLDIDSQFTAFRVYRKDKVKQAVSRFVAAKTGLYHVWKNDKGELKNHYDRPSENATPFSLNVEEAYDYHNITSIVDSIYQEERELDILFENFQILPINLIYENILKDTSYLEPIARKINLVNEINEIGKIQRKTVKTASPINKELIQKFNNDGGYRGKIDRIFSRQYDVLKHINSLPNRTMMNESCFWHKDIIDMVIDTPYLKSHDNSLLVIEGVLISYQDINQIFIFDPIIGKKYQAQMNLSSEYFGSIYWKINNSTKARFRCLIPLEAHRLSNQPSSNLELSYQIGQSSPVKLVQIDASRFVSRIQQTL